MVRSGIKRFVRGIARRFTGGEPHAPAPPPEEAEEVAQAPIEVGTADALVWAKGGALFMDVREPNELYAGHVAGALLVPMRQVPSRLAEIPRDRRVIVYCAAGARSHGVSEQLRAEGFRDVWSLAGGFGAWAHAGGATVRPPTGAKFGITSAVTVDGRPGTVQGIVETPAGMRYDVQVVEHGRIERVTDVEEARLARPVRA